MDSTLQRLRAVCADTARLLLVVTVINRECAHQTLQQIFKMISFYWLDYLQNLDASAHAYVMRF